jgi:flagellar protein FliO/FliZ
MLGRLLVSLAFVLGLMWVLARRVKRPAKANSRLVDVLSRQQLSRTASVAVVRVGEQALILGITECQVSVLGEADLAQVQSQLEVEAAPARPSRRSARTAPNRSKAGRTSAPAAALDSATLDVAALSGPTSHAPSLNRAASKPAGQPVAPGRHSATPGEAPTVPDSEQRKVLSGSALSPDTWRQTLDALRELTVRTK